MSFRRCALMTWVAALLFSSGCNNSAPVGAVSTGNQQSSPHEPRETTFDDIKFEMEKTDKFQRTMLTKNIEALFGRTIRIRGYMFPTLKKKGLTKFVLVRDNLECCFGAGAALYDCIFVQMAPNKSAEYSIRPVAVEGKFRFQEFVDYDGNTRAIYHLDGEAVE